jgi:PAS domain S-box-containing protein
MAPPGKARLAKMDWYNPDRSHDLSGDEMAPSGSDRKSRISRKLRDTRLELSNSEREELHTRVRALRAELAESRKQLTDFLSISRKFVSSMHEGTIRSQQSRRRLLTQYTVNRIMEEADDLQEATPGLLEVLGSSLGSSFGVLWMAEGDALRCAGVWHPPNAAPKQLVAACRQASLRRGVEPPGLAWVRRRPVWTGDFPEDSPRAEAILREGPRAAVAVPIQDGCFLGVIELFLSDGTRLDESLLSTLSLIGAHIGQFVERRKAERERDRLLEREREARRQIAIILESISDAFFAVDREWRFTYVNGRAEQLWGLPREELLGRNIWKAFPQALGAEPCEQIRRAAREEVVTGFETVSPVAGTWVWGRAYPSADGVSVYFQDVTERKVAEEERERYLAREWMDLAQAEERRRISRELHDRVAHDIALVHQSLELYEALKERDPARASRRLELARKTVREALESTRNLAMELRHPEVPRGLEAALTHLLSDMVPPDVGCELSVEGDETLVPPEARTQLFLILREAIRNAVAHSGCGRLTVGLDITRERIVGSIGDDGSGFAPESAGSQDGGGLRSMAERAALLGGALGISSQPEGGTRVRVTVPLEGA